MTIIYDTLRRIVGRRNTITRDQMAEIIESIGLPPGHSTIAHYGADGALHLPEPEGWVHDPGQHQAAVARAWARTCRGITCVSLTPDGIRHDEPGSMHPLQMSDLCFVPANVDVGRDDGGSAIRHLRGHCTRLILVRDTRLSWDIEQERAIRTAVSAQADARWARMRRAVKADGKWVRILDDGALELRDPNDGQSSDPARAHRYQYRVTATGTLESRVLPPECVGDAWADLGVPEWEARVPPRAGPVWDYYEAVAL